ncbi:SEC1 family transport protein SLY1 [Nosema granulosis]|uniref:SEC1 family transport protein SLY1 n=1 Tax=Nosema granulosis TaxID=83296 RepID=A0A9P6H1R6_9MICR|nr:SEC1 family transport protein SLY1 [Nosema granulosis]
MIRDLQKNRIKQFLISIKEPWKVLVLDSRTQDIISPLIKMNELRDCGVTSHFLISQKRYKISATPAVYFVSEIDKISQDVIEDLYSVYYINCINSIKIRSLEKMGHELSSRGLALRVASVYDQFLDFVSLQEDFFSLEFQDSFINRQDTDLLRRTVVSLLSVFVTLEGIPMIYSRDDTSRSIARMLREKIKGTNIIKKTPKRPLLVLVDRDYDIVSPIQHVWSYSALIDDLLGIRSNKVVLNKDSTKVYDLDPTDPIWKANRNEYFPLVVERVDKEFVEYKKEMALRSIDSRSDKKTIQEALEKAPELAKKNESVNAHISMCLEMVEIVKKRSIDDFYKIEKSGYSSEELISISEKGEDIDILRLALSISSSKEDLAEALLKKRNIKSSALEYFRKNSTATATANSFSGMVGNIVGNIKKLLPVKETSPISELVESVYNKIKNQQYSREDLVDPLDINNIFLNEISSIVVFSVGGATYSELKTLKVLEEKLKLPIIYGGTEVLNAAEFIRQIELASSHQ